MKIINVKFSAIILPAKLFKNNYQPPLSENPGSTPGEGKLNILDG